MKERNNEINIKINVSNDLISALANIFVMAKIPLPLQTTQTKSTTGIPPSPVGFRVPPDEKDE